MSLLVPVSSWKWMALEWECLSLLLLRSFAALRFAITLGWVITRFLLRVMNFGMRQKLCIFRNAEILYLDLKIKFEF